MVLLTPRLRDRRIGRRGRHVELDETVGEGMVVFRVEFVHAVDVAIGFVVHGGSNSGELDARGLGEGKIDGGVTSGGRGGRGGVGETETTGTTHEHVVLIVEVAKFVEREEVDDRVVGIDGHVDDDIAGRRVVERIEVVEAEERGRLDK